MKDKPHNGNLYLQYIYLTQELFLEYIKDPYTKKKKENLLEKIGRTLEVGLHKRDYPVADERVKSCSTSLVIWKLQRKT